MRRTARNRKADALTLMFPHTLDLVRQEVVGADNPMSDEKTVEVNVVESWPCSVQSLTNGDVHSVGGELLKDEFLILCPCIDGLQEGSEDADRHYKLILHINGRKYTIEKSGDFGIEFIENQYVFDLNGYKIGCKMRIKTNTDLMM